MFLNCRGPLPTSPKRVPKSRSASNERPATGIEQAGIIATDAIKAADFTPRMMVIVKELSTHFLSPAADVRNPQYSRPIRSTEYSLSMEVTEETTGQIIQLWLEWQSGKPTHQRLFFKFFEDAVQSHPQLSELSLLDTLGVLNSMNGITPQLH